MTDRTPRVCIIGAGVSGLCAAKALGDWGVPYTCFEASDDVGGNWYFRNPNGRSSAYRSLHIDTSKAAISFSDFPLDDRYPDFPHHTEIHRFLLEFADRFGLREHIRFQAVVERAEPGADGGWQIRTDDGEVHEFASLLVGNGHHWDPLLPEFPGRFDGETMHSHHYIDPTEPLDLRDKRVVVVPAPSARPAAPDGSDAAPDCVGKDGELRAADAQPPFSRGPPHCLQ